jgi:hypothetical protein
MRQKLRDHPDRTIQVGVDFADYIGEVVGAVAQADLAHDACVIDEDIERRELPGQRFLEYGDRLRIAGIALRHMNVAELHGLR